MIDPGRSFVHIGSSFIRISNGTVLKKNNTRRSVQIEFLALIFHTSPEKLVGSCSLAHYESNTSCNGIHQLGISEQEPVEPYSEDFKLYTSMER